MTPVLITIAAMLALLALWLVIEYLAACKCETCPRGFALYHRGEFYLCSICAKLHDYAQADLKRYDDRRVSLRHNKASEPVELRPRNEANAVIGRGLAPLQGTISGESYRPGNVSTWPAGPQPELERPDDAA